MSVSPEKTPEIIVAAMAANGIIGAAGIIPWHCAEELRLFRTITLGGTVLMGRRTYQSIGHPLEGRRNIVVSSTLSAERGIIVVPTFAEAVATALAAGDPVYYCGGVGIYAEALDRAEAIYLSVMNDDAVGDRSFPRIDPSVWRLVMETAYTGFVHRHYRRYGKGE
jgi:dihydrofolate reductase